MTIHFVCAGNTYRSRLAEMYFNSLRLPGLVALSSGVMADMNSNGAITIYAHDIAVEAKLEAYMKPHWDQLTQARIDSSDVVVCVNRSVYRAASERFNLPLQTIIWDIPDIGDVLRGNQAGSRDTAAVTEVAVRTYRRICRHVDALVTILARLQRPSSMADVLRADGSVTGERASVTDVNRRGLWRAGVHGILYRANGTVLIQQRSASIIGNPGKWEVSLGGGVDAGETPITALRREIHEELGLTVAASHVAPLGATRYNHYLPAYGFHSRVLLHNYAVLVSSRAEVTLEASENQGYAWLSIDNLERALLSHPRQFVNYPALHAKLIQAVRQSLGSAPGETAGPNFETN